MNNIVYFYTRNGNSPGVTIILYSIIKGLKQYNIDGCIVNNLSNIDQNDLVIPYGTYECYELLKTSHPKILALLVDYYSLGCKNKIKFYLKKFKLSYKDLYYSIISYIRYHVKDIKVAKSYTKVMMASSADIEMLSRDSKCDNFFLSNNCVRVIGNKFKPYKGGPIKLGIIAHWTFISIDETRWFIEDIFPTLRKRFPNIELLIAGRGDNYLARKYFCKDGVRFIGEVDNLNAFFEELNIYIATVPKGCGVLNKLLDAFSYKVFSIGIKPSFSAFKNLKNGYIICETADEYESAIQMYIDQSDEVERIVNNASKFIEEFHSNDFLNYKPVLDTIASYLRDC